MTSLFISDLHLDESRPEITRAFYKFLEARARTCEALYILGDFFEAWIGDDEDSDLSREVVAQLKQLTDSGVKLFIMHGNRDFLLGKLFCQQTGATLLNDPSTITLGEQKVLLMHGDSLCTKDIEYMKFREQARSSAWQDQLLSQPLEVRRALVAQMRAQSQAMNSNKSDDIMDVTPDEVVKAMKSAAANTFIHGHTHRPGIHDLDINQQVAKRFVLGDWESHLWFIEHKDNQLHLFKESI